MNTNKIVFEVVGVTRKMNCLVVIGTLFDWSGPAPAVFGVPYSTNLSCLCLLTIILVSLLVLFSTINLGHVHSRTYFSQFCISYIAFQTVCSCHVTYAIQNESTLYSKYSAEKHSCLISQVLAVTKKKYEYKFSVHSCSFPPCLKNENGLVPAYGKQTMYKQKVLKTKRKKGSAKNWRN